MKKITLYAIVAFGLISICNIKSYAQLSRIYPTGQPNDFTGQSPANCGIIEQTNEGGYLLNYSSSFWGTGTNWGQNTTIIIKTNSEFVPLWRSGTIGFNGKKTLELTDGSIIFYSNRVFIVGNTTKERFSLNKLNASGTYLWSKSNYDTSDQYIRVNDAFITTQGNIRLGGSKNYSNPILMDFDTDGNFIQGITFNNDTFKRINSLSNETVSGNYYAIGDATFNNKQAGAIVKLDAQNNILWAKCITLFDSNSIDYYSNSYYNYSLIMDNGNLLISFGMLQYNSSLICLFNPNGDLQWSKRTDSNIIVKGFTQTSASEILVTAKEEYGDSYNFAFKINSNGDLIWSKRYGRIIAVSPVYQKSADDWCIATYGLGDTTFQHPAIFNINSSGNLTCYTPTSGGLLLYPQDIVVSTLNLTINSVSLNQPTTDSGGVPATQTYTDTCLLNNDEIRTELEMVMYPNPSNGLVYITSKEIVENVQIHNLIGQQVMDFNPNKDEFSFDILISGIYFIKIKTKSGNRVLKFIIK